MADLTPNRQASNRNGISQMVVEGFKSIAAPVALDIRPLTVLAGANSSGKSSIMQPLLMLKQTLEATYDPGDLLLNGSNVRFTSAEQLFSKQAGQLPANTFTLRIASEDADQLEFIFEKRPRQGVHLASMSFKDKAGHVSLRAGMSSEEIENQLPAPIKQRPDRLLGSEDARDTTLNGYEWQIERNRCFLNIVLQYKELGPRYSLIQPYPPTAEFGSLIRNLIHVPGLRGNPERTYKTTALGAEFPGTFENYVASVISHWDHDHLAKLGAALEALGLTWKVEATQVDDTQVELQVGRLLHSVRGGTHDMVNIADVGFGVSQTLPVLVALLVAKPGQLVYIEQPEIHLHPKAQVAMAQVLADAAKRGVTVIIETHSSLLLRAIQTLVAKDIISGRMVKLHWFTRNSMTGMTEVTSSDIDETGAYGDWPVDFDDVTLSAESDYLDAVELKGVNL
jgi:ABC-type cobalamin/Fe3+-siderophores transport system ATPase subunit